MFSVLVFEKTSFERWKVYYVGCQVLQQTAHVNIFVRSQAAIHLFENTCEDILNLSKVVGNKNKNLPAIQ